MPGFTSPLNFPYPLYTESANGPAQIQALAEAIDDALTASQALIASVVARKAARASGPTGTPQSIPDNAPTNITFTSEDFDNDNIINLGVSTTNATITTAGLYLVSGVILWTANATGSRSTRITQNGTLAAGLQAGTAGGVLTSGTSCVQLLKCAAADVIRIQGFQNSGGALNALARVMSVARVSS